MLSLPPLIEEDIQSLELALDELLQKSEATGALLIDKGGPLITQRGSLDAFDTTTIAALAAGSFAATEAIAGVVGETNFSSIYQQGERQSLLVENVDANLLLIIIFQATSSVGVVKYYSSATIQRIAQHLRVARFRSPAESVDLVALNLLDTSTVFRKKA